MDTLGAGQDGWFARPAARRWRCAAPSESARSFHASLPGYSPTPLVGLPSLAEELGVSRVLVKDESSRLGLPAFKVLGASWAVSRVVARRAGLAGTPGLAALKEAAGGAPLTLVTATDGNHGRAVAKMASLLGIRSYVVVPQVMSDQAAAGIAAEGADVVRNDGDYDAALRRAAGHARTHPDAELVQDVAWPGYEEVPGWIVEGYATLCLEVDEAMARDGLGRPGLVVVPVGVGSLAQAVIAHYRSRGTDPAPGVLSVEPDTAACALASLRRGGPCSVRTRDTIMTGLNCGTLSTAAWPCLREGLDGAVSVRDEEAARAVEDLAALGVSSGPSGAATLAGARAALTGAGAAGRRAQLGVDPGSVVVLLSTEGGPAQGPSGPGPHD